MRETVIHSWCDGCMSEDETRTVATHVYTIGIVEGEVRPQLKLIEMCDTHMKTVEDFRALLEQTGQTLEPKVVAPPRATKATDNNLNPYLDCPIPGCNGNLRKSSMPLHIWMKHNGGIENKPKPLRICPTCKFKTENASGSVAQHRSQVHNYSQLDEAIEFWNTKVAK